MTTYRKLVYMSSFSSQSSQTDRITGPNVIVLGENSKRLKLSKNMTSSTQKATPSLTHDIKSPDITPCFSRKVKINHILRFYLNMRKSTINLRESKSGKSQRDQRVVCGGPSSDNFDFPPRGAQKEKEMARIKRDVLRTIKRMMEENKLIRVRLLTLRQMSRSK